MEGKFLSKDTPGRAVEIPMGFHTNPHLRIQNLPGDSHTGIVHAGITWGVSITY